MGTYGKGCLFIRRYLFKRHLLKKRCLFICGCQFKRCQRKKGHLKNVVGEVPAYLATDVMPKTCREDAVVDTSISQLPFLIISMRTTHWLAGFPSTTRFSVTEGCYALIKIDTVYNGEIGKKNINQITCSPFKTLLDIDIRLLILEIGA